MPPDVRLKVGGQLYGGWQAIRIQRSIEQIAGRFDLRVTERWSGQDAVRPIRPGAECQVLVDGVPVITGYVDDVQVDYGSESHSVTVTGRDKTGDLVDCTAQNFNWMDVTLAAAAERLCSPYGITVTAEAQDIDKKFSTYSQNPGDSVFASLDGAANIRGVLLISDGNGGLIITRASTLRLQALLATGDNILSASATFSHKDRFSEYTVTSQEEVKDGSTYETAFLIAAKSTDPVITRHRPKLVAADKLIDRAQTQERADWERNVRYGRSQQIQYTVQGWKYDQKNLWPINRLVPVKDDLIGIDADLLIVGVTLMLDENGTRAEITVAPREAHDLVPLPEEDLWNTG